MEFSFVPTDKAPRVVATIGVFDGVHRGHQALISAVRSRAEELGAVSMVITFDPPPVVVLAPHLPPQRLGSQAVEERWLRATGVDHVWFIPFSEAMSEWSAEQFLTYLTDPLDLRELWIGYDFRFGKARSGDAEFLRTRSAEHGFLLRVFDAVSTGSPADRKQPGWADPGAGRIFSSTWVRELLAEGNVSRAAMVLGHAFEVEGKVGKGLGLGSRDLVPTANLVLPSEQVLPQNGIYVGWAALTPNDEGSNSAVLAPGEDGSNSPAVETGPERGIDSGGETWLWAVANVGCRPTVEESGRIQVEVHLLDWDQSIYGWNLRFRFGDWIRAERKFAGLPELREAIEGDLEQARDWFRARSD